VILGDMFDLLMPLSPYTVEVNAKPIELLKHISNKIEVVYFEGNHDFFISHVLKNAVVFEFEAQPALFDINGKKALIMHGDKYGTLGYILYTKLLRNKLFYRFMRLVSFDFIYPFIIKPIMRGLKNKKLCRDFDDFEGFCRRKVEMLLQKYEFDILIEGHFHQGKHFAFDAVKYYNIQSFACNKSFFQVEFSQSDIKLIELNLGAF
jgi:UDP-2,3-diacylglucosamine hydrolase